MVLKQRNVTKYAVGNVHVTIYPGPLPLFDPLLLPSSLYDYLIILTWSELHISLASTLLPCQFVVAQSSCSSDYHMILFLSVFNPAATQEP